MLASLLLATAALAPGCAAEPAVDRGAAATAATIRLDRNQRYQTIVGWEATAQAGQGEPGFAAWSDRLFDLAVDDLGINRLRLSLASGAESRRDAPARRAGDSDPEARCRRYLTVNDNDDPQSIDWSGFDFDGLDDAVERVVLPIRRRLEARGERLYLNLEYVAFIGQCDEPFDYVHARPAEYAEFVLAAFLHLRERFDLIPDGFEVILEPDNVPGWSGERIGQAMVAAAARLAAAGFRPEFIAPSTTSMAAAARYLDEIVAVPGARQLLSEIAYHRYRGVSPGALEALARRAAELGMRTSMLEHVRGDVEELYSDLAVGQVSAWQQYTLAFAARDTGAQYYRIVDGQPVVASRTRLLRQYFHYVRAGAVRIGAASDDRALRALAFEHPGGQVVVVLHVARPGEIAVRGLPAGPFGASLAGADFAGVELGPLTVGSDGTARLRAPRAGVLTIYPQDAARAAAKS